MNDDNLIRMGLILLAMAILFAHITNMLQDKQMKELKQQIVELTAKEQK